MHIKRVCEPNMRRTLFDTIFELQLISSTFLADDERSSSRTAAARPRARLPLDPVDGMPSVLKHQRQHPPASCCFCCCFDFYIFLVTCKTKFLASSRPHM